MAEATPFDWPEEAGAAMLHDAPTQYESIKRFGTPVEDDAEPFALPDLVARLSLVPVGAPEPGDGSMVIRYTVVDPDGPNPTVLIGNQVVAFGRLEK